MSTRRRSQRWWCHQCSRRIRASDATANQLDCPYCHGGFVEEIDDSEGHGGNFDGEEEAAMTQMMHSLATFLEQVPHNQRGFNPILLLQGQMQDLAEDAILFNNEGQRRMRHGNIGDYFLGPGLDQLIQELAENYPNRHGASPASKASVEAMETVKITNRDPLGTTNATQCIVCKDKFEVMPTYDSEYDGLRALGRNNYASSSQIANLEVEGKAFIISIPLEHPL